MKKSISMLFNDLFDGFFKSKEASSFILITRGAHSAGIISDSIIISLSKNKNSNITFSIWDSKQIEGWHHPYVELSIAPYSSESGVMKGKEGILTSHFLVITFIPIMKNPTKELTFFITRVIKKVRVMLKEYDYCIFKEDALKQV